jgi:hypothetical protein
LRIFPLIELRVGKVGRAEGRDNELAFATLVLRSEQKFAVRVIDNLKLTLVLKDMIKDEFLFGGILKIRPD